MPTSPPLPPLRVILPVLPDGDTAAHVQLAADLAGPAGRVVLLAVVPVLHGEDLPAATVAARAARRQLRALARLVPEDTLHEETIRAAESLTRGIQLAAGEETEHCVLIVPLPAGAMADLLTRAPYAELLSTPPCDTVFSRPGSGQALRSVLVSARGGPHAELALDVAQRLGRARGASVTVMHVDVPFASAAERQQEQRLFQSLVARSADNPRLRTSSVPADSASEAVQEESLRHDLVVLGARVSGGKTAGLGDVPRAVLEHSTAAVLIVKPRTPVNPVIFKPRPLPVDKIVNDWFIEHTTHCRDYSNLAELIAEKQRRHLTVGVALIAGPEHDALPAHARVLVEELGGEPPLVDDVVVMSGPDAGLIATTAALGLRTCVIDGADADSAGRLMRASLRALQTDIVLWISADIRNVHAKLIYGLAGPLIMNGDVHYVQGFYGLPADAPDADLQNVVGEFTARPLLNLFFAELSGLIDPLTTEHAILRSTGLNLPLFSGSAAQIGLLIDVYERLGSGAISQVALEERIARPLAMLEATRRAFSATQIVAHRLGLTTRDRTSLTIKLIHQTEAHFEIDLIDAREIELLP